MMDRKHPEEIRHLAWIGDAVLTLYVREWILRETDTTDGDGAVAFSSNRFLASIGNPTDIEAEIGRVYHNDGLAAAFAHIESKLLPGFRAQQKNRRRQRQ